MLIRVPITSALEDFEPPSYATEGSVGMDVRSTVEVQLAPGERKLVSLGFSIEIPVGYEAQIRPRSGLAYNHGITVLNSPGTIDSDFRGIVQVLLINHSQETFWVTKGMRVAQMVFAPVCWAKIAVTSEPLSETERGTGGFGSTGLGFCSVSNGGC